MSSCNVTCVMFNSPFEPSSWPKVAPNPDVSGKGVLVGFVATAYLTFSIVGIYYYIGYVPEEFLNCIDRGIIDALWSWRRSKPAKTWEPTLRAAVLMFSDQQIVTGIALLSSGYAQLSCGLSVYHWQMVIYLAWFSSLTHLTTLTILRQYFRNNPEARLWRAVLILIMVIMLGIALLPSGDFLWLGGSESNEVGRLPALCYFKRLVARAPEGRFEPDPVQTSSMLISILVLFSGFLTRLIKLSQRATNSTKLWVRTKPGKILKDAINNSIQHIGRAQASSYWRVKLMVLETTYVFFRASFDIYESTLWEILWLAFALAWGTSHLVFTRSVAHKVETDASEENTWGFGQVFPVILLALPILSIGENYYEIRRTMLNESGASTPIVHNDAGHGTSHNPKQPRFMRIGQWPTRLTSGLATPSIALETHSATRRTGTDMSNEERTMGTIRSRASLDGSTQSENEAARVDQLHVVASNVALVEREDSGHSSIRDYYQFEWFWILISMVLIIVSEVIIFGLVAFGNVALWQTFLMMAAVGLGSSILYIGFFVILMEYHEALESFILRYARLRPRVPYACLRVSAYLYICGVIGFFLYIILEAVIVAHHCGEPLGDIEALEG